MSGMELVSRLVSALAWPVVVIVVVLALRTWITKRLDSLGITLGSVDVQLKTLDLKVDGVGKDIAVTLSDNMPQPTANGGIPTSLVDLMATVNKNREEGINAAFDLVSRALKENYPQLRRVLPSQLSGAMHNLVNKGEMEADVASSVQQLQELLDMTEWATDPAGDTRAYAFLMLAEGAIHGILRSAAVRSAESGKDLSSGPPAPVSASWQGTYNDSYPIQLNIAAWSGSTFDGIMTYPDEDTATSITGTIEDDIADGGVRLTWKETQYTHKGNRRIDFDGSYSAIVKDDTMYGAWHQASRRVAGFTMTAFDDSRTQALP
ncbi:hypothetical protein [Nonomuraea sp. NPDC002799]